MQDGQVSCTIRLRAGSRRTDGECNTFVDVSVPSRRYMDTLGDLSSASDSEAEEPETRKLAQKRSKTQDPDLEALEAAGFKSGPSVLQIPEPTGESSWDW